MANVYRFVCLIVLFFSLEKELRSQTCPDIIGYYPNWQWYDRGQLVKPTTIQYSKYSIINYAFFKPEVNGSISSTDAWADQNLLLGQINWSTPTLTYYPNTSIIDLAHNAGVKVLPSIGGWTLSDNFPSIAATSTKRTLFAHSCCDLIRTYNFDGIDLDWEYPGYSAHNGTPNDKQNFTLLLQQIRDSLTALGAQNNKTYMLTFCIGASRQNMLNIEWNQVQGIADIINLMSYDFFGSWDATANHNSPLYKPAQGDPTFNMDSAVTYLLNHYQVPPNKLAAGVAFYGRSAKTSGAAALFAPITGADNITFSDDDGTPLYYNVLKKQNLFTKHWDATAQVPYLTGNGSLQTFVSFDDEQSVALKANYIKTKNLRGAIIWEITGDYLETAPGSGIIASTPLVDTLKSVLCNGIQGGSSCGVPSNITSTVSSTMINLNWTGPASSYLIEYKTLSASNWSNLSSNTTSCSITGLSCNTGIQVRIQSVCSTSSSSFSSIQTFTTSSCVAGCPIPSGLSANATANSLNISWSNVNANSYNVQYKVQGASSWISTTVNTNSMMISNLLANTAYEVKVQAVCASSSSAYSATSIFSTLSAGNSNCTYPIWNSNSIYYSGDTVLHNAIIYRAKYWTQNNIPSSNYGNCCAWDYIMPCGGYTAATCYKPVYDSLIAYTAGQQVYLNGYIYQAQWWTLNANPLSNSGPGAVWQLISTTPCHVTLNVKAFIEGFYVGSSLMQMSDTLQLELHEFNPASHHPLLAGYKGLLQTNGSIQATFPSSVFGKSCFIVLRHRNALETWSANPITLSASNSYDFTTNAGKAYGNNQVQVDASNWSLYSGDINQDGAIDGFDYVALDIDIIMGAGGYLNTDLNGDGAIDAFDYLLLDPNVTNGIGTIQP